MMMRKLARHGAGLLGAMHGRATDRPGLLVCGLVGTASQGTVNARHKAPATARGYTG